MRNQLRLWRLSVAVLIVMGTTGEFAFAQSDARSVIVGRQRIQADLTAAMADGRLTRMEQYGILLDANDLLTSADLVALQRTMDRLGGQFNAPPRSTREELSRRLKLVGGAGTTEGNATDGATTTQAGLTLLENDDVTKTVAYDQSSDSSSNAADAGDDTDADVPSPVAENPFKEEDLQTPGEIVGSEIVSSEGELFFDDDSRVTFESCGPLGGCGAWTDSFSMLNCLPLEAQLSTGVESFKGPVDLNNQNGNFGVSFAVNAGIVVAKRLGIGLQGGANNVLTNFHGTRLTGDGIRSQNFTTVGLFQRLPFGTRKMKWGFTYDWLQDDYYDKIELGQWRVKIAYELSPCNAVGVWANIPEHGESVRIDDGDGLFHFEWFEPVTQANLYWRHFWENGIDTSYWIGAVEEPGEFAIGTSARIPLTCQLSALGNFNYVLPSASGAPGGDEEMWQLGIGIEFIPGGRSSGCHDRSSTPLLPLPNNATFAVRRFQ